MEFLRDFLGALLRRDQAETTIELIKDRVRVTNENGRLGANGALLLVTVILMVIACWRRRQAFLVFQVRGINGPRPNFLIGNLQETKDGMSDAIRDWSKKFGKTYGFFEGPLPMLATSDIEILKQVFITQHSKFAARKPLPVGEGPDGEDIHIAFAHGQRWKKQRDIMSPLFRTSNLKQMLPEVQKCNDKFMKVLEDRRLESKPFDIYREFQSCTLETICRVGFGLDCDGMDFEAFRRLCRDCFQSITPEGLKKRPVFLMSIILGVIFPSLKEYWNKMQMAFHNNKIDTNPSIILQEAIKGMIEERKREASLRGDFLQQLLDASDYNNNKFKGKKSLEAGELYANSSVFLLAGYDTTSTTLAFAAHALAIHPEMQRKIQEEIDEIVGDEATFTYEQLKELKYLDRVISEVLRLHPVAPSGVTRMCIEETTVKGIHFPRGLSVVADVRTLHSDPELWGNNPEEFDPDRFLPEKKASRNSAAYLPFGIGPRHCIGMRFALVEMKLILVTLLRKYTLSRCEETVVPMDVCESATLLIPKEGVMVKVELRD
ncbi:cytochrome P450 3A24-like [Lineus longissimus]|uniref:cytochrome P450 3A24-like n=1 Tax=Lineus longissimus TaxID=88925 RepID=UPI002B4D65B3